MKRGLLLASAVLTLALGAVHADAAALPAETPTLCAQVEVEQTVRRFLAAFNRGQAVVLEAVWAREPDFQWYSTGGPGLRMRESAMHRPSLVAYFVRRHRRGERLRLLSLQVNGNTEAARPYGNFEYRLTRSAGDLRATVYNGKGALHCYASRPDHLIVWSMAEAATD